MQRQHRNHWHTDVGRASKTEFGAPVAILGNGVLKGGAPRTFETLHKTPGLEDIWQLHYSFLASMRHNAPLPFIANRDQDCTGRWLKLTAQSDGSFAVYNAGTGFQKTYSSK